MAIDKKFLTQMKSKLEGHDLRVGVLRNAKHQPAAPRAAGLTSVMGGPARKTQRARDAEINSQLKKLQAKSAGARKQAKGARGLAKSLRGSGFKKAAKLTRAAATNRSRKGRRIAERARSLRASRRKPAPATLTLRQVMRRVQQAKGIDLLRAPFRRTRSRSYKKFIAAYIKAASAGKSMTKVEKLLLDVVLVPILGKEYGSNSPATRRTKGFNRLFVDTGQMIKGIKSRIRSRRRDV